MSVEEGKSSKPKSGIAITWPQLAQRSIWVVGDIDTTADSNKKKKTSGTDHLVTGATPTGLFQITTVAQEQVPLEQQGGCEYLDHTADVQLHAWGKSRAAVYASSVVGLHTYMVDAPNTQATHSACFHARGHDEESLLYDILDEALFMFASEAFVITRASVTLVKFDEATAHHNHNKGEDNLIVKVNVWGYYFQEGVHAQGTEVKAITYSNMKVVDKTSYLVDDGFHLYVIVDI